MLSRHSSFWPGVRRSRNVVHAMRSLRSGTGLAMVALYLWHCPFFTQAYVSNRPSPYSSLYTNLRFTSLLVTSAAPLSMMRSPDARQ